MTATVPVSHTHSFHDITAFVYMTLNPLYLTSDTLYKVSHPQFMSSHHIIYDITFTVFMSSIPRYLTLHPQYLCHHTHSKNDL